MNEDRRKIIASTGVEMLKEAVTFVLYQQHKEADRHHATLSEIRERLGLPRGSRDPNSLIRGVLEVLEVEGLVCGVPDIFEVQGATERDYKPSIEAAWQLTKEGIALFESEALRKSQR